MALHSYRLCALLFIAIMLAESRAEESDGTGSSAAAVSTPTVYSGLDKKIAGYTPASDVDAHKMIDVDMMMIEQKFSSCTPGAAMTEATSIYTTGRNSKKSSGFRNIKGFGLKAKEPLGDLFIASRRQASMTLTPWSKRPLPGRTSQLPVRQRLFGATRPRQAPPEAPLLDLVMPGSRL